MAKYFDKRPASSNFLVVGMCAAVTLALGIAVYNPIQTPNLMALQQADLSAAATTPPGFPTLTPTPTPRTASPTPCSTNCSTPAPISQNLLVNGDFEIDNNGNNKPDNWTEDSRVIRDTNAYSGQYSMGFRKRDNTSFEIKQTVYNITAGAKYNFGAAINISDLTIISPTAPGPDTSFGFKFSLSWRDKNKNQIKADTVANYTSVTNGWTQFLKTVTAPAGTSYVHVRMLPSSLGVDVNVDHAWMWRQY